MLKSNVEKLVHYDPTAPLDISLPAGAVSNVQREFNAPLSFIQARLYRHTGGEGDPEGSVNAEEMAEMERKRTEQRLALEKEKIENFQKTVMRRVTQKEKQNRANRQEKMHRLENKVVVLREADRSTTNLSRQRIRATAPGEVDSINESTISHVNVTGNITADTNNSREVSVFADVVDESNENEIFALKDKWNNVYATVRRHYSEEERQSIIDRKRKEREKAEREKAMLKEQRRLEKEREKLEAMRLKNESERLQKARQEVAAKNFEHQLTLDLSRRQERKRDESSRYVEALKEKLLEKIETNNITLPPLCNCGLSPLDNHADNCANNCIFYQNPREYVRALADLLVAMEVV